MRTSALATTTIRITPLPIKVPRLRLHLLPIDVATPRARIHRNIPLDRLKRLGGRFITPRPVPNDLFVVVAGGLQVPIRRAAFPFAEGGVGGRVEGEGECCAGEIVGCGDQKNNHFFIPLHRLWWCGGERAY